MNTPPPFKARAHFDGETSAVEIDDLDLRFTVTTGRGTGAQQIAVYVSIDDLLRQIGFHDASLLTQAAAVATERLARQYDETVRQYIQLQIDSQLRPGVKPDWLYGEHVEADPAIPHGMTRP